jgi:hypothetical protein
MKIRHQLKDGGGPFERAGRTVWTGFLGLPSMAIGQINTRPRKLHNGFQTQITQWIITFWKLNAMPFHTHLC